MSALSRAKVRALLAVLAVAHFIRHWHYPIGIPGNQPLVDSIAASTSEEPTIGGFNWVLQRVVAWARMMLQVWNCHRRDIWHIIATWISCDPDSLQIPSSISRSSSLRSLSSTTSLIVNIPDEEEIGTEMSSRPRGPIDHFGEVDVVPTIRTGGNCPVMPIRPPPGLEAVAPRPTHGTQHGNFRRRLADVIYEYPCICDNHDKEQDPTYRSWSGKKSRDGTYDMKVEENWHRCKGCGGCECGRWVPQYCKVCNIWLNGNVQHRNHLADSARHHKHVIRIIENHLGQSLNDMAESLPTMKPTPVPGPPATWTLPIETIAEDRQFPDITSMR